MNLENVNTVIKYVSTTENMLIAFKKNVRDYGKCFSV